jgi:hypothetical protein
MDIEVLSLNLTVKVHFKNERGLSRSAGLEFEIQRDALDGHLSNKGKFNKFVGDMVKDAYDACLEVAKDEYKGKGRDKRRADAPPSDDEVDAETKAVWAEQDARAEKAGDKSLITPESENRDAHPGKE